MTFKMHSVIYLLFLSAVEWHLSVEDCLRTKKVSKIQAIKWIYSLIFNIAPKTYFFPSISTPCDYKPFYVKI